MSGRPARKYTWMGSDGILSLVNDLMMDEAMSVRVLMEANFLKWVLMGMFRRGLARWFPIFLPLLEATISSIVMVERVKVIFLYQKFIHGAMFGNIIRQLKVWCKISYDDDNLYNSTLHNPEYYKTGDSKIGHRKIGHKRMIEGSDGSSTVSCPVEEIPDPYFVEKPSLKK